MVTSVINVFPASHSAVCRVLEDRQELMDEDGVGEGLGDYHRGKMEMETGEKVVVFPCSAVFFSLYVYFTVSRSFIFSLKISRPSKALL